MIFDAVVSTLIFLGGWSAIICRHVLRQEIEPSLRVGLALAGEDNRVCGGASVKKNGSPYYFLYVSWFSYFWRIFSILLPLLLIV